MNIKILPLALSICLSQAAFAQAVETPPNLLDGLQNWDTSLLENSNLLQPLASPNVQGHSSKMYRAAPGISNFAPEDLPTGNSGLKMWRTDNTWSDTIDLFYGPIKQVKDFATANEAGPFFAKPLWLGPKVAQVWYNTNHKEANIYSLRQTFRPPNWLNGSVPHFGGVVVGQVKYKVNANNSEAYAVGSGVYFGEWSPALNNPSTNDSTNLNMGHSERTVWYVGDNAVTSMPSLVNATYNVVGIRQTGVNGNLPHAPNLYTGTLTANYGSGNNTLTGAITRGSHSVNFAGTTISGNGTFKNGANTIEGRFYNNAQALAGIYTGGGSTSNHIAFGGSKTN